VHGGLEERVAPAQRCPVQRLEQPLGAACDQFLGFDLNDIPAPVMGRRLTAQDVDADLPTVFADLDASGARKRVPVRAAQGILRRSAPAYDGQWAQLGRACATRARE